MGELWWVGDRQCESYNPLTRTVGGWLSAWGADNIRHNSMQTKISLVLLHTHTQKTYEVYASPNFHNLLLFFFPSFSCFLSLSFFFKFSSELKFYLTLISVAFFPRQLRTLNIRCLIWCRPGSASDLWELTEEFQLEVPPLQSSPQSSWAHKPTEQAGRFAAWHKNFLLPPLPPLYRTGRREQRNPRVAN